MLVRNLGVSGGADDENLASTSVVISAGKDYPSSGESRMILQSFCRE
jgi:hypothetical protein